jgi:ubiquinone/menaquinone biosynthesis C-methylase UbiE
MYFVLERVEVMSEADNSSQENTYVINAESMAEINRLMIQDRAVTKEMGGLLPHDVDPSTLHRVLDIACGPGNWVLELASAYRHMEVVGVDLSKKMVDYANSRKWPNTSFRLMNVLQPLDFPDNTFDFVNARLLFAFMPKMAWPTLVKECMRVLRPGGILRLTECERPLTNSRATQQWGELFMNALHLAGTSFSVDGKQVGITLMLSGFLQAAGYQNIRHNSFAIDFSAGGDARGYIYENSQLGYLLASPFVLKMNPSINQEQLLQLSNQAMKDLDSENFRAIWYFLSAWGSKAV